MTTRTIISTRQRSNRLRRWRSKRSLLGSLSIDEDGGPQKEESSSGREKNSKPSSSSSSSSKGGGGSKGIVADLVTARQWDHMRTFLSLEEGQFAALLFGSAGPGGDTLLHLACRGRPPLDIVGRIADIDPSAATAVNAERQTPLHVAASSHDSLDVLKLLIQLCPRSVDMKDSLGRTPLILLLLSSSEGGGAATTATTSAGSSTTAARRYREKVTRAFTLYEIRAIDLLLDKSPNSIVIEDREGMGALEHAIMHCAPEAVIRHLQVLLTGFMSKKHQMTPRE